jgi:transcriptional repressor NrdR
MLLCPHCKKGRTAVLESRSKKKYFEVRRRRECPECGEKFTTIESVIKIKKGPAKRLRPKIVSIEEAIDSITNNISNDIGIVMQKVIDTSRTHISKAVKRAIKEVNR